ncbi:nuclear transport factor 2 family protein [Streptomyces sp. ET3-23]|uniref:ester cyclase n=1 Tax=Streptomyces sp. ET3-23 TaxID=2885643 RepID=UPI001D0FB04F|nr:nuclear transport factor 2 family protein [Streptomyces sp. ET3-23]MCC2280759.1 nuclear transport factor 2 family protein [Streptomyces sp. ET3-23]
MSVTTAFGHAGRLRIHETIGSALNDHDLERLVSCYTEDMEYTDFGSGTVCHGKSEFLRFGEAWLESIPDFHVKLHSAHAVEQLSTAEWTMSGTVEHPLPGLPAGAVGGRFSVRGSAVLVFADDGRVCRERDYWNAAVLLQQLADAPRQDSFVLSRHDIHLCLAELQALTAEWSDAGQQDSLAERLSTLHRLLENCCATMEQG